MVICWDNIECLRFNSKTGKWYKDKYKHGKRINTNSYEMSENFCKVCGNEYLFSTGNKNICCSLSCNVKYKNSIYGISEETAKKISNTKKGIPVHSEEEKKRMSERMKKRVGPLNSNWKGGHRTEKKKIYDSKEYKEWRKSVFKRDNWTCNFCGQKGYKLEAHHIKMFSKYPELVFEVSNGITLCKKCHQTMVNNKEHLFEDLFTKILCLQTSQILV